MSNALYMIPIITLYDWFFAVKDFDSSLSECAG